MELGYKNCFAVINDKVWKAIILHHYVKITSTNLGALTMIFTSL